MSNVAVVTGHTIAGRPGRYVLDARANHLVSDSRLGPGESIQAGELLLSALASCAMANFEANAAAEGLGTIDPTRYDFTHVTITVDGVEQADADTLAARFVASCPIYNTIRRGGNIELMVIAR